MRINSLARVGASLHEQVRHRHVAIHDGIVNGAVFAGGGCSHADKFGAASHERADKREIASFRGTEKAPGIRAIDESFQLRPTGEAVGAGENALSIVQRESCGVWIPLKAGYFGNGGWIGGAIGVQKIFGLFAEMLKIGLVGKAAKRQQRRTWIGHDDLLWNDCPVSACMGFQEDGRSSVNGRISMGSALPADTEASDTPPKLYRVLCEQREWDFLPLYCLS
jgi:hypothetical protein